MTEFDKVIRPGGVGKVTASLDTSHYVGLITKSVRVKTNEPGAPPLVLLLKARIVRLIEVTPTDTPVLLRLARHGADQRAAAGDHRHPADRAVVGGLDARGRVGKGAA